MESRERTFHCAVTDVAASAAENASQAKPVRTNIRDLLTLYTQTEMKPSSY